MMKSCRVAGPFLLTCCVFSVSMAEDWPQYRGIAGDGKSAESIADVSWNANGPKVRWKVPTNLGFSSFSVANGRAFTLVARDGKDGAKVETCVAYNADTGEELWSVAFNKSDYDHDGGNAGAPDNRGGDGPRGTPTTDGENVFVYDAHLVLTCLDARDGSLKWKRDIIEEFAGRNIKWYNATSPLMHGNSLYVAGGGAGQSFLAFDKRSGELIWSSGDELLTHATPHITTIAKSKQIVFFMQSGLVGIDAATGSELWRTAFPFSVSTAASPVSEDSRIYCSAGYGVGAGLFEVNGGSEPNEIWFKSNELMNHWSTPVVHEGHLYGIFEFKKYGKAPLQCVELATGQIKWAKRGFGPGNCILVGDKLVVLSDAGELVIASAKSEAYKELGRSKVLSGKCWSTPAYSDGRVYIRSTEQGACVEL